MDNVEGSSPCDISLLPDEVIQIILSALPITDLLNAALVCKEWRCFMASSHLLRAVSYSIHTSKPWLFVLGQSTNLCSAKNRVIGFDPLAWRWNHIRPPPLIGSKKLEDPRSVMMNVEEGNGILFYLSGRCMNYTLSFLNPKSKWEESPPMSCWRHQHPLVCYLGGPTYNYIFVVGGVSDFEREEIDPLCAEMLHLKSGVWESLDPLPYQFKASASSTWLSFAAFDDRIYVLERYSGECCYFDLQRKLWKCLGELRPTPSSSSVDEAGELILVTGSSKKGLVVGGLRRDNGGMSFRLWNFTNIVDNEVANIACTEMARMPCHIFNLITGKDDEEGEVGCWEVRVKCKGIGDLIYIYSDHSNHVCICDISGHGGQVWRTLPNQDGIFLGTDNYSKRLKFVCSPVTLEQISL